MNDTANRAVTESVPPSIGNGSNAGGTRSHPLYAIEVEPEPPRDPQFVVVCYRVAEFLLALTVLVVTLPIILLEALIIKLDSPGPALFFQTRFGRSKIMRGAELIGRTDVVPAPGRTFEPDKLYHVPTTFTFVKFRTMYVDARERFPELYRYNFGSHEEFLKAYYKDEDDPRVTRVGRWFRLMTVDELPNLWSVVTGHAALVGPRPENPSVLPYYSPEEMRKFTVRSGVTGFSQIKGRGNITIGEHLYWDVRYVRERSVMVDVKTLFITLWLVLTHHGAF